MAKKRKFSWTVVVLAILLFPPLGVILFNVKLNAEMDNCEKNGAITARIGLVLALFFGLSVIISLGSGIIPGQLEFFWSITLMGLGIAMIIRGRMLKKQGAAYARYAYLVKENHGGSIERIAEAFPVKYDKADADLRKMISYGFFEGAYMDEGTKRIVLAGAANAPLHYKQGEKLLIVECPGCGARNALKGDSGVCEYCGTLLTAAEAKR